VDSSPGGWTMWTLAMWRCGKERGVAKRIASDYIVRYIFFSGLVDLPRMWTTLRLTTRRLDNASAFVL
jgi:hypothetical protein